MMVVPKGAPTGLRDVTNPPSTTMRCPVSLSAVRVVMVMRETEPAAASASPRKPRVRMWNRSSAVRSLEVACRLTAVSNSSAGIPQPSSMISISFFPACSMWMTIFFAPASMAFSISSLTTEAGRSITSPAAIWLATSSANT